jgi:putative AbiEii toxin of type IV toxin-antitoxin system
LGLPWIYVLPQISPLQTEEHEKSDMYVEENLFSDLSSRHFRNQLNRLSDEFAEFKRLAESTWPGLKVDPVERRIQKKGTFLWLPVRDGDFVGEVGLMGHGLQMWLQMIWFISRVPRESIIVLDEPDVYMHPDLQRKLFRLISGRFPQTIVATHSIEIMAEADPSEILVVDKRKRRSRFANSEPAVQLLIDQIGGVHNVHLARLWSARKFLLLEGEDMALLRRFHAVLYPEADLPLDALPSLSIGGWTGWPRAIGSSLAMKNAVGDRIVSYCILDRDYHTDAEVAERLNEAQKAGVNLHVWTHKEIENLLLNPNSIRRVIARRTEPKRVPSVPELWDQIQCICDQFKDTVIDGLASEIQKRDRIDLVGAIRRARERVLSTWSDPTKRIAQVPGKEVLGRLSEWSQKKTWGSLRCAGDCCSHDRGRDTG